MYKLLISAALTAVLVAPGTAMSAAVKTMYPGSACKNEGTDTRVKVRDAHIRNDGLQWQWVNCPIATQQQGAKKGVYLVARIGYVDNKKYFGYDIRCEGTTRGLTTDDRSYSVQKKTVYADNEDANVHSESLEMILTSGRAQGIYSLRCYLPPRGIVYAYYVHEY